MQPVGATAVVQVADINKDTFTHNYQSAMSFLVLDFTYLEGRDGELLVKELATVDFHSNRVSSYLFKRPYAWEEVPMFNARMNQLLTTGVIGLMVIYSELETVLHR